MFLYSLWRVCAVIAGNSPIRMCVVFLVVLFLVKTIQILRVAVALPPGTWKNPVIKLCFKTLDFIKYSKRMEEKYGKVVSMRIGTELFVVISNYKLIKRLFSMDVFTARPRTPFISVLEGYGIVNTDGKLWKEQRRFINEGLRYFGMTSTGARNVQMEKRIMEEVEELLYVFKAKKNEPVDLNPLFAVSVSNVICDVLMSTRFTHNDTKFRRFMHLIEEGFKLFGKMDYVLYVPALQHLPTASNTLKQIAQNRAELGVFLQKVIDEHKLSFDKNHMRDILDTYLLVIQKAKEEGSDHKLFEGKNHDRQVQQVLADLFSAGMETIKSTLQWAVVFMLHHPELMKAVQDELDQVVGRTRLPKLEDMPFLPVTESTIMEVLRRSSVVPMGTTHSPTRDITVDGYCYPAGVQVVPYLQSVNMNPELWEEPERFNPSRFIDSEGKVFKPEYYMPFGVGRRMCLGEVLAKMELFLFFSSLVHSFDIAVPEGAPLPSLEGSVGITICPHPFQVCLKARPTEWETVSTNLRSAGSN